MKRRATQTRCRIEPLERRDLLALIEKPYPIIASSNPFTPFANAFTDRFRQAGSGASPAYTGSDGLYSIPLNGIDKIGSAYTTPGWQMYTFGDTFIGSYNPATGVRSAGTKLVNNTAAIHLSSGATPAALVNKWRGSFATTPAEAMSVVARPQANASHYYWPSDGVVVDGQLVQFALRQSPATLETQGVTVLTAPVDATFDTNNDWPYAGNENGTYFNADNRFGLGSARNLFLPDTNTTNPFNGPRTMGAAILDTSTTQRAFVSDGFLYTFGTQLGSGLFEKYAFVARATPADFSDTAGWQFWSQLPGETTGAWRGNAFGIDAIGWGTALRDVNGAFITDMASEFSVTQLNDGTLAMLYSRYDVFGNGQIAVRYAPRGHPQGPWTLPSVVYSVPTPNSGNPAIGLRAMGTQWSSEGWFYGVYGAKIHPQFSLAPTASSDGKLLVSFHVMSLDGTPGGTQVFGPEFTYGDIYRPRFLELTLRSKRNELGPALRLLPSAGLLGARGGPSSSAAERLGLFSADPIPIAAADAAVVR